MLNYLSKKSAFFLILTYIFKFFSLGVGVILFFFLIILKVKFLVLFKRFLKIIRRLLTPVSCFLRIDQR